MNATLPSSSLLSIIIALSSVTSSAEDVSCEPEIWSGVIERYTSAPLLVKYVITRDKDRGIQADLKLDGSKIELKDYRRVVTDDDAGEFISFRFKPGPEEVECRLDRDNSEAEKFVGTCPPDTAFETAGTTRLTMERSTATAEETATPGEAAGGASQP